MRLLLVEEDSSESFGKDDVSGEDMGSTVGEGRKDGWGPRDEWTGCLGRSFGQTLTTSSVVGVTVWS